MAQRLLLAGCVAMMVFSLAEGDQNPVSRGWPPNPRDMVSVELNDVRIGPRPVTLYKVPADRYFVLTEIREERMEQAQLIEWGKTARVRLHRLLPQRRDAYYHWSSETGIAFAPGSEVALRSLSPVQGAWVHMVGYLVDP